MSSTTALLPKMGFCPFASLLIDDSHLRNNHTRTIITTTMDFRLYGATEKQAVVLDIGAALTKAGFAGEVNPRTIIPSVFRLNRLDE